MLIGNLSRYCCDARSDPIRCMACLVVRDGQADYRVHLEDFPNVGAFFRDEEGVALVMGTLDSPLSREHLRCVFMFKVTKWLPATLANPPRPLCETEDDILYDYGKLKR